MDVVDVDDDDHDVNDGDGAYDYRHSLHGVDHYYEGVTSMIHDKKSVDEVVSW